MLQQRLSQLQGIGEVDVGGSALPAVRVELNPGALFKYGIGLEDVRAALASANANSPKGAIEDDDFHYQIYANDQATQGRAISRSRRRLSQQRGGQADATSARSSNSVEDLRNAGLANGKPAVGVVLSRQPGANIIEAVDAVKAELPHLQASLPGDVDLNVAVDRSTTIRVSLHDTRDDAGHRRSCWSFSSCSCSCATCAPPLMPSVAVPVSLIGTFAAMYLLGFSLDNLSLMALTISTGFVVDDAIVVLENITPPSGAGKTARAGGAAGRARSRLHRPLDEPFADRGVPADPADGRLRRAAVPRIRADAVDRDADLAGRFADDDADDVRADPAARDRQQHGRLYRATERVFEAMLRFYRRTLRVALVIPLP